MVLPVVKRRRPSKKGTVLIEGWLEGKFTGTRYVHATGTVKGKSMVYTKKKKYISINKKKKNRQGRLKIDIP